MEKKFAISFLPDTDIVDGGEVLVRAMIGAHHYDFLLDTGCAKTSVIEGQNLSSLISLGSHSSHGAIGTVTGDKVEVKGISLGPIEVDVHQVLRISKNQYRSLFGMDILSRYPLNFCFRRGEVRIEDSKNFSHLHWSEISPVSPLIPHIDGRIGRSEIHAIWDTGAGATLVDLAFIKSHPESFEQIGMTHGSDISNASVQTPMFRLKDLALGGHHFPTHQVVGLDLSNLNKILPKPVQAIIGVSTMMQADWFFDFPNRRWAISRVD